jgi:hypothetical protein
MSFGLYSERMLVYFHVVTMSRQAVRDRALKKPHLLDDIEEENLDYAEEGLQDLLRSDDQRIKLRAVELYLKTKGKERGYVERKQLTGIDGEPIQMLGTVLVLPANGREIEQNAD